MNYKFRHRLFAALMAGILCCAMVPSALAEGIADSGGEVPVSIPAASEEPAETPGFPAEESPSPAAEPNDTLDALESDTAADDMNTQLSAEDTFVAAVDALDRDAILAAANAWGLANQAWQADPENEELNAALEQAITVQDDATAPLYAAEDLYYELSEEEQGRQDVADAYSALMALYAAMTVCMDNPTAPDTETDPPEDALAVLYGDLPDAPTGSYMGSMGLPIATGETKISISEWKADMFTAHSAYFDADALNSDDLTLTVGKQEGEDYALVPILVQVEYPANGSSASVALPEDVEVVSFASEESLKAADDTERSKALNYSYTETSASVSGFYVKASADFDAALTYSAPDGTTLTKTLHVTVAEDAALVPTLFATQGRASTYAERPTPSVTTGKITKVEKTADTWLIWFNGEPAYCCSHGKNGQPTGCPTYSYAYTSTVDADQFIPGDHYGNQIRIWGGLGQLSLGLLAERHTDAEAAAAYAARNASTYSAVDAAVLEYAYSIYDEDQLFVMEHFPESQAARLYLESAKAALGQIDNRAVTYDGNGYYTYIYDSGNPNWQIVAVEGPPIEEEPGPSPTPTPTYDATWNVDITESASVGFEASMTVKVDKYANVTHEALSDAEITVQGSPANGDLDGGSWQVDPASQIIRTDNGDGSVTFTYKGSVTKSASRSDSGSVTGQSSQDAADSEAARQRAEAESRLRGEAQADAQAQANAAAQAAAEAAREFLVQETGVPHGYNPTDSSSQTLTVQPNSAATAAIANQPWRASVRWEKLDAITGGRLTEDTQFTLYEWSEKEAGYRVSLNYHVVRLADGAYTVRVTNPDYTDWEEGYVYYTQDNLGKFKIEEKTAAYGYTQQFAQRKVWPVPMSLFADSDDHLSDGPWAVEFTIDQQNKVIEYLGADADRNQPWGNQVIIRKTDSETGNAIKADAQFSLYEWNAERGLYEISPDYAIVRDADGSYTVQCLHKDWTLAGYGSLYYEDTLCDVREDTANHDGTSSKHNVYYQDYALAGYPNDRAYTNDGQYLIVEHLAPSGYYGDWTDAAGPGAAGSDLGKRAYYLRLTGDGSTILLDNAAYNADILTENKGGILVETTDGIVTVEISATAKPAGRSYATDASGLAANEDAYTMTPKAGAFQNDHSWGELVLTKQDLDQAGGTAQHGDASVEGAVYDLYAAEDIRHPDGVSGVVDYSKIVDANGNPLHHTTVLTNGGWDSNYLPILAKDHLVASAAIKEGRLAFANLYLGRYYLVERATGLVLPLDENGKYYVSGQYPVLNSKLEPTGKYKALAQSGGEYTDYVYRNQYSAVAVGRALDGSKTYDGYYLSYATGYLCDEVNHYENLAYGGESRYITRSEDSSPDAVLKSGFEIRKLVSTTGQPSPALKLQGAGFTVYRVSALSKANEFVLNPDGTYNVQSILDAYRKDAYDNETAKYDFSGESQAVATMYERDKAVVEAYNYSLTADGDNANGSGKGWVPADKPNNYRLAEIFTNEEGTLRVQGLPYGQYLVVETTTPKDVFQADPFMVTINSAAPQSVFCTPNGAVTKPSNSHMTYNVLDEELEGYLQLVKVDAETGKAVKIANTAFSLYMLHENGEETLVEMTDPASGSAWAKTSVFYTDENGELKTPEKLPLGRYRIVEVEGPEGFFNDTAYSVEFELTSERVWQVDGNSTDDMDLYVLTETYANHETLGQLTIRKEGDVLTGYEDGKFLYTKDNLAGAVYEIRAKGDVATGDRQGTLWYADGDLVATVTTGEDGQMDEVKFSPTRTPATYDFLSVSHNGTKGEVTITLPLGTYEIREIKAPYGFTLADTVYEVTLAWADQSSDIVLAKTITVDGKTQEYGIINAQNANREQLTGQPGTITFENARVLPVVEEGKVGVGVYKLERSSSGLTDDAPGKDGLKTDTALLAGGSNRERIPADARPVPGATYELYTADDIYSVDGNLLAAADSLLATAVTGEDGLAYFAVDVPLRGEHYGSSDAHNWTTNSGRYYIRETNVPDGYLIEQSLIPVEFTYENQFIAWQVVDCLHSDKETTVEIGKRAFASVNPGATFALPGATLTVTDWDGNVVDTWQSGDAAHLLRGLHLDHDFEGNEDLGKVYTLTETRPADGYTTAKSISFKLRQAKDASGSYTQQTEVWVLAETASAAYQSGSILSPTRFADDAPKSTWATILRNAVSSLWATVFGADDVEDGAVIANWTCTGGTLTVTFTDAANEAAIAKCLRESDFAELTFDKVYLAGGSASHFFADKQVPERPEGSEVTFSSEWTLLQEENGQTIQMTDTPTRVKISKVDITTHEEVPGAQLQITDRDGNVVDEWISTAEPHFIEARLLAGETYTLTETLAPTESGYVPANTIRFTVADDDLVQQVMMQDDYTKVSISKTDITTGEEIEGAHLRIVNAAGETVAEWVTDGGPHTMERLPAGIYQLVETQAPTEDGYVRAETISFEVAATGDIQKVEMQDDYTKVEISKQDLTTGRELPGATLRISDKDGTILAEWKTDGQPHRIDRLAPGNYILTELSAPKGYRLSESVPFAVQESGEIQRVTMYDAPIGVLTVSKRDAANNAPLPGASLAIRDADGRTVDHWLTTDADHAVTVLSEEAAAKDPRTNVVLLSDDTTEHVYVLVEEAAPAGYHLAGNLTFKVMELDGELILFLHDGSGRQRAGATTLTLLDERTPDYTPEQPGKQFPQTGALF